MTRLGENVEAAVDALTAAIEGGDIMPATVGEPFTLHFVANDLPSSELSLPSGTNNVADEDEPPVGVGGISVLGPEGSVDRNLHMSAVDYESLEETLRTHIGTIAAAAYIFGRSDQIADTLGNNSLRFVRTHELPTILRQAQESLSGSEVVVDVREWLQGFDSMRATVDANDISD